MSTAPHRFEIAHRFERAASVLGLMLATWSTDPKRRPRKLMSTERAVRSRVGTLRRTRRHGNTYRGTMRTITEVDLPTPSELRDCWDLLDRMRKAAVRGRRARGLHRHGAQPHQRIEHSRRLDELLDGIEPLLRRADVLVALDVEAAP